MRAIFPFIIFSGFVVLAVNGGAGELKKKPTLEEAIRQWQKGLASKKKEEREKALLSMLPSQKDLDVLFPKQTEKLKPIIAKGTAFMLENVDEIAKEVTKSGEIKAVKPRNIREKDPEGRCKRVFEMIAKDVPVFDVSVSYVNGDGSGSEFYVFVNQHWLWFSGLDQVPAILEKMK